MRTIAVIQARMGSTRLPGKILESIEGRPLLAWTIAAVRAVPEVDDVVLATSDRPEDDAVAEAVRVLGVRAHRGSVHDVLRRVADADLLESHEHPDAVIDVNDEVSDFEIAEVRKKRGGGSFLSRFFRNGSLEGGAIDFTGFEFGLQPLLWPVAPLEGPHEIAGTLGEARGDGQADDHAGGDQHAVGGKTETAEMEKSGKH